ncbi:hypothetical protein ACM39_11250 [Chryseobacterium sp. FH2]|uniref:hypothetical protein n=1 Tax=Chryseobacterium sp. FH2 TaxID=1674291 RepID=UPI00065A946A|nr:hypothetical protein [Chryseobacterium sp. FH2]KMQ67907.1 hypothetical protein ACM39_11250 [Chryseobacterium sp. FH2]
MKKILYLIILGASGLSLNAQVLSNFPVNPGLNNSNVMFDGSTSFSAEAGAGPNVGKGVVIPSVDLVNFEFDLTYADGFTFPTYFDGMIVYNRANGTTLTAGNRSSTATAVTPGYYFFYNPNGAANGAVQQGVWRPLGGDPKVNIANTETTTNTLINNSQVYARRGQFTVNGTSTAPTSYTGAVTIPGAGSLYRITIFQPGTNNVYANGVYSYDKATGNLITGSPSISVVYPNGTYDYIVEYTKN